MRRIRTVGNYAVCALIIFLFLPMVASQAGAFDFEPAGPELVQVQADNVYSLTNVPLVINQNGWGAS